MKTRGNLLESKLPCPYCPSSDAWHIYDNGGHCFSCNKSVPLSEVEGYEEGNAGEFEKVTTEVVGEPEEVQHIGKWDRIYRTKAELSNIPHRKLSSKVCDFFGVKTFNERLLFPFYHGNEISGLKVKKQSPKEFWSEGNVDTLWGRHKFPQEGGKRIIITEGELDTLAVAQACMRKYDGKVYPVVSMGSKSNTKLLLDNRDYLKAFDERILWLDNDAAGQEAVQKAIRILGYIGTKVAIHGEYKDANEVLMKKGYSEVLKTIWDARERKPASIVEGKDTWKHYKDHKNAVVVPWAPFLTDLNGMIYGRWLGSITLLIAGTGVGKSTWMKEDIFHLLNTTDSKVGCCLLEESVGSSVADFIGMHLEKRLSLPDVTVTEAEERKAWEEVMGINRLMLVDHQGALEGESLIDKLEYLILSGCMYIWLDHITIATSEHSDRSDNAAIDSLMNALLKLVTKYQCWIGVVSHLRKTTQGELSYESGASINEDAIRGSGSIKQVSFQTLSLNRNKIAETEDERQTSRVHVLKCRRTGRTGFAGAYKYNTTTGRLISTVTDKQDSFDIEEFVVVDPTASNENEFITLDKEI